MADDALTPAEFAELRRLPPAQAMAWMQRRTHGALTFSWQDLWQQEHGRHFTVSRLARLDLLQAIQEGLSRSVAGDLSRRDWMRDTEQLLAQAGWWGEKQVLDPATGKLVKTTFDPARLKLIYDTNTRQAAAAGQWERIQRTKRALPYLRYITKRDDRVRPQHASWDNVTLPVDDAFWQTHYPPNGWRCRCRVVGVSQAEYDRGEGPTGAPLVKEAPATPSTPFINKRTGEVSQVPAGVDPGFDFNPGQRRQDDLQALAQQKLATSVPALAKAAEYQGLTLEAAAATYAEEARMKPKAALPRLPLGLIHGEALASAAKLDLDLSKKMVGLDYSGTRHVFEAHGGAGEQLRGQVALTAGDVGAFASIFNAARLEAGVPAKAPDGSRLVQGEVVFGAYRYTFAAKVGKYLVTLYSMYKRPV